MKTIWEMLFRTSLESPRKTRFDYEQDDKFIRLLARRVGQHTLTTNELKDLGHTFISLCKKALVGLFPEGVVVPHPEFTIRTKGFFLVTPKWRGFLANFEAVMVINMGDDLE